MDMNKLHEAKEMERQIIDLAVCIEKLGLGVTFKDCWQNIVFDYIYKYDKEFYEKVLDTVRSMVEVEREKLYEKFESL